ncbi:MAG: DegV family protein [Clostridia bacterium]|nr:DegV family protein [Clostridia bacterium]
MSIFFTDTDCEMDYVTAEELNIKVIGMPYTIKGQEQFYDFGKNTNIKEFYDMMRSGEVATTSALNIEDYIEYFEPILSAGEDILYVHFSSELSGTFDHMKVALNTLNEKYPDRKVTCFDTKNISLGAGIQVIEAAKLHNAGASDEEVVEFLTNFSKKIGIYFYVDNLKYLKRGGRISATSAVMGTMLNIKPILSVTDDGKLEKLTTVMGTKKAVKFLYNKFTQEVTDEENTDVYIVDADNKEIGDSFAKDLENTGKKVNIKRLDVGPVVGAHCGPGTIGLIFVKK